MGQYFASNFTFFFCLTWLFPYLQRTYGLQGLTKACAASLPPDVQTPYAGIEESHPYAVQRMPDGSHWLLEAANKAWPKQ